MSSAEQFEAFMVKIMQRPLPVNDIARIHTLARELAEGVNAGIWDGQLLIAVGEKYEDGRRVSTYEPGYDYREYFSRRWKEDYPNAKILQLNGFLDSRYIVTQAAFALIGDVEPVNLFISYRRKESSAFALLVLARLKEFDLNAFLDMALIPGDNWHAYIKEQIQHHDYFILLLGKETLESSVVKDEISWAIEAEAEIIPIWHNGFEYKEGDFDLSPEIRRVLRSNHSIRVLEESALAYNNAIVELLNRFGITP